MTWVFPVNQIITFLALIICSGFIYLLNLNAIDIDLKRRVRILFYRLYENTYGRRKLTEIDDKVCFLVARSLRAGAPLERAIIQTMEKFPQSSLTFHLNQLVNRGIGFSQSLDYLITKKSQEDNSNEKLFLSTVHIAKSMGGNSARIFEKLGDCFASIYDLRRECSASLTQVKLSTMMISVLPVAMLFLSNIFGANVLEFLFTNPIGLVCLFFGGIFQILGLMWMKKQIRKGVSKWIY